MRKAVIVLSVLLVGGLGAAAYSRSLKAADPGFKTVLVSWGEVVEKALAVGAIKPDLFAGYFPARRAASINPAESLRYE